MSTPLWGRIWVGKQQGICGVPLYLLLNFAVSLQMQKVSACLLQSLSAILLPNCPHHRKRFPDSQQGALPPSGLSSPKCPEASLEAGVGRGAETGRAEGSGPRWPSQDEVESVSWSGQLELTLKRACRETTEALLVFP